MPGHSQIVQHFLDDGASCPSSWRFHSAVRVNVLRSRPHMQSSLGRALVVFLPLPCVAFRPISRRQVVAITVPRPLAGTYQCYYFYRMPGMASMALRRSIRLYKIRVRLWQVSWKDVRPWIKYTTGPGIGIIIIINIQAMGWDQEPLT